MIRFLCSRLFLSICLCLCVILLALQFICGSEFVNELFAKFWAWFIGGDYSGYAVLSSAFIMNTWGVAVRSVRRRVQLQCKRHVEHVLERLSRAVILSSGKEGVLEFAWRERRNPKVRCQVRKLMSAIEHYTIMVPEIFTISTKLVNVVMALFAVISVVCLVKEVNGRFSTFLLMPYPMFWLYSNIASLWIRFLLEYRLWCVLRLTPTTEEDEEILTLKENLKSMERMFNGLSVPPKQEKKQ